MQIQLTQDAEHDLANIAEYTLKTFGIKQAEKYYSGLTTALETLALYPELGTSHHNIKAGLKKFVYQNHSIYFYHQQNRLLVLRILNQKQDPLQNLAN